MWQATDDLIETARVAYARIGIVIPYNDPPGAFEVPGQIRFDVDEHDFEEGEKNIVYVGVKNVVLEVIGKGFRVVPGTLVGENPSLPTIEPFGDTANITGPLQENGECLKGNPIGDRPLAIIEPTTRETATPSITVSLYSFKRCFRISEFAIPHTENQVAENRREAVLNALLKKRRLDAQGRTIIARDTRVKAR